MNPKIETVSDLLYWAYSNLAMAHAAIEDNSTEYNRKHYFIRNRLFKGLKNNSMSVRSLFDDERLKMILPQSCCYCGSIEYLAADHIIPRKKGGSDSGENLIWACRACNSSKSTTDMLEWMQSRKTFPSILLYRRYLKILINYCIDQDLLHLSVDKALKENLPFNLSAVPKEFLPLSAVKLWITDMEKPKKTIAKKSTYRIANWNLERPLKKTKKLQLALDKIEEINPDICILSETSILANLGADFNVLHSQEYDDYPSEHWVAIWSRWPIKKEIVTFDKYRTVCALIDAPFGEIIVYATIIPYRDSGVRDGGKYAYAPRKYKAWEMHKENILSQGADWMKISGEYNDIPFIVAGDFNQTRDNLKGGYGTKEVRNLLTVVLDVCNLSCVTNEDFAASKKLNEDPKKGFVRRNIDHICISKSWEEEIDMDIGAWDHFTSEGEYMTDHNGVYLDFKV